MFDAFDSLTSLDYNHKSGFKSFLQRQVKLTVERGRPVDRVELFREAHASSTGEFISPVVEDAHVSSPKPFITFYLNHYYKTSNT